MCKQYKRDSQWNLFNMFQKKILANLLPLSLILTLPITCGRPPGDYSGICNADCSNALIATNKMIITSLVANPIEIECNGGQTPGETHAPFPLRFRIERPSMEIGSDGSDEGSEEGEGSGDMLPATAISYDYQLLDGILSEDINNFETSCTDSCGTGMLEIVPVCGPNDNIIQVLIQSGPISETLTVTLKGLTK